MVAHSHCRSDQYAHDNMVVEMVAGYSNELTSQIQSKGLDSLGGGTSVPGQEQALCTSFAI